MDTSSPYATGSTVTVLGNTGSLVRTGNTFGGWNTVENGTGTAYNPGATFTISSNVILYAQWHATVIYNANGATGGTVPVDSSSPYENGTSVTVLGNTGSLVKTGFTFLNWNTAANGTGISYSTGNTFAIPANTILYAQWTPITYTITYNGNGNTGGSVPVDPSSPYVNSATVTVLGNTGSLVKTGYVFSHWNTAANNSGTNYSATNTFTILASTVLYAQWTITYTITYDADGATGGSVPVDPSSPYATGSTVTVLGNTGTLTRAGNTFSGWDTTYNGNGTAYAPGSTFAITSNIILYAQWHATVTYNANGATGGTVPVDSSSPYENGTTVTVLGNTGSLVRAGYSFSNWNTAANGTGTAYAPTNIFSIGADTVLYAQWTLLGTHTVTYNSNGATSGTVPIDPSSPYTVGATVTVLGNTGSLARIGYRFSHWNTAANDSGTSYSPSATFTVNVNTVLYAQWTTTYVVIYDEDGATGGTVPIDSSSPYVSGASVTILGNTGSLTRTGSIFAGWNTAEDGTGSSYLPGAVFTIGANVVLYVQWRATVTYNANGATSGTVPVDSSSPYFLNSNVTILGNTGSLIKTGNSFAHWNTAANGSGVSYSASDSFAIASDTVLYAQWQASLTYDGNGATSGTVPVDSSSPYAVGSTVTVRGNTGSLMRVGKSFTGWNTAANGSGTTYAPSATFAIAINTTLYAQWTGVYTVLYDNDGATGGTVPVDASSPYLLGATVTVLGNTGSLVKTGNTFSGWNTVEDGTGTAYAPGASFTIAGDTTLFAQWTATLTYNGNGATGGSVPVDSSSPYPTPFGATTTVTVRGNTGSLVKLDEDSGDYFTFFGWNTAANGTGSAYSAGNTFAITANTVLYAQWVAPVFTVAYNSNGANSGTVPIDASSPYSDEATVTVKTNSGSLAKIGYAFAHWNTAANGSGISYSPGATFVIETNTVLYAQWIAVYTLIYDEDGATGGDIPVDSSSPYVSGATVTVLGNTGSLVRSGNTFGGWNTIEDGSGTQYAPGATFTINANTTLFAQWTATVIYNSDGATGGSLPVDPSSPYPNPYGGQTVVTVLGNPGSLVRTGYTFAHWGTGPNNSGEHYRPEDQFVLQANTILYAHWELIGTHHVVYNDNGATGGSVPNHPASPYLAGSRVTVLENSGLLVKDGSIFDEWNTAANGSGTSYEPTNQFIINADTILYAQWTNQVHQVTYNGNGATNGTPPVDARSPYDIDDSVTILTNSGSLARTGYTFDSWNTSPDGSGIPYGDGATYAFTSDLTLYAQWTLQLQPLPPAPPVVTSPVATVSTPVSETVDSDEATESVIEATLELLGGEWAEVSVTVPAGASSSDLTLSISPGTSTGGISSRQLTIKVTATDSSGAAVTHFDKPLSVNMGHVAISSIPMFSEDGITWTEVPLLSGTTLPDSMQEGYYVASDGHTVILTRHLTYFGIRRLQKNLVATPRTTSIETGKSTRVVATGGSGIGLRGFVTSTPDICKISSGGLLTGLSAGKCTFQTTKAGDSTYSASQSTENNVTVYKAAQRKFWLTVSTNSIRVGERTSLAIHGGSGTGALIFKSNSPLVCSVSSQGIITGISIGSCTLSATKASDKRYLSTTSRTVTITVSKRILVKP